MQKSKKYREMFSYLMIGILTTLVSLVTYYLLTCTILNHGSPLEIQIASLTSWIISVTFAYFTNRKYVFLKKDKINFKEVSSFYLARISTLLIDLTMMFLLVSIFKFNDKLVKLIVQVVIFILNYLLSKYIVFKNKNSKKINKKIIFYVLLFGLFFINLAFLNNFSGDNYFNYGFAYNIVNGLIPYKDFNMVLFPFSSFLMALIMKIFSSKLITYYLFNSLIFTLIIYYAKKLNKFSIFYVLLFLLIFSNGGYNSLSLLLFLILLWQEQNKKNDYLIGLILGLLIITNQKMLLLCLPSLLTKDILKILKRLGIALIPILGVLIYLLLTNSFMNFVDYTIFGLFDFGSNNFNKMFIFVIVELLLIISLIYKYLKSHDLIIIYLLAFQIIALPILDPYHISLALIPFICYFYKGNIKLVKTFNYLILVIIGIFLLANSISILKDSDYYLNLDINSNYYLTISDKKIDYINKKLTEYYYLHIEKYDNIYFIYNDMYYHKLKSKIPINKFDLIMNGNNGYKGNEKLKKQIKEMNNVLFLIENSKFTGVYDQTNYEMLDFIKNNYPKKECLSNKFCVYEIKN